MKRELCIWTAMIGAGLLVSAAHAAPYTWNSTTGNWSDSANWAGAVTPDNDGTADLTFSDAAVAYVATVNPAALVPSTNDWSINSLTFAENGLGSVFNDITGAPNATLTLGAGGITQNDNASPQMKVSIIAAESQTWSINNWRTNSTAGLQINNNLTLNDGVMVTKTGTVAGKGDLWFNSGTTTTVGTGAFTLKAHAIYFLNTDQYGRLGTNALTVDSTSNFRMTLQFNASASGTFANDVNIVGGLSGTNTNLGINYGNGSVAAGTTLTFTGDWSGNVVGGATNGVGFINNQVMGTSTYDERYRLVIQGNNFGLTSAADPATGNGALHIHSGVTILDNANALGTGNSLGILVGNNSTNIYNTLAGLLATDGNDVGAKIYVRSVINGSNQRNSLVELGLSGAGSVNYTGKIYLDNLGPTVINKVPVLRLTAPAGGTAVFSGQLVNNHAVVTDPNFVPVVILGEGTVKLSGDNSVAVNGYRGTTSVRGGTLLVGHDNALGTSTTAVSLGDTVVAPAGGDVVAATTAELTNINTFAAGVLTFTGAGISTLDGVTLNNGDRILYKDATNSPERSGVYVRDSATQWTRATDLDTADEFPTGLRVHVTGGSLNTDKNFYLTTGLYPTAVLNNNTTNDSGTNFVLARFLFNPDASSSQDVALLTDGAFTVSRDINVTDNLSSGKSSLGGNSAHASIFSGTVSLARGLTVTAATNGSVDFSGDITGGFGVTKEGAGQVIFSAAKSYTGSTTVTDGILAVNSTLASGNVSVGSGATLQGTGNITNFVAIAAGGTLAPGNSIGTLTVGSAEIDGVFSVEVDGTGLGTADLLDVLGSFDITNAVLDLDILATLDDPAYIIAGYGSLTGAQFADVLNLPTGYVVDYAYGESGNQIALVVPEPATLGLLALGGLMISIRRRKA